MTLLIMHARLQLGTIFSICNVVCSFLCNCCIFVFYFEYDLYNK